MYASKHPSIHHSYQETGAHLQPLMDERQGPTWTGWESIKEQHPGTITPQSNLDIIIYYTNVALACKKIRFITPELVYEY